MYCSNWTQKSLSPRLAWFLYYTDYLKWCHHFKIKYFFKKYSHMMRLSLETHSTHYLDFFYFVTYFVSQIDGSNIDICFIPLWDSTTTTLVSSRILYWFDPVNVVRRTISTIDSRVIQSQCRFLCYIITHRYRTSCRPCWWKSRT